MGLHEWLGVALLAAIIGPTLVLLTISVVVELIQRKKADANAVKADSA